MIKYDQIAAPNTFIGAYLAHMSEQETPTEYDFWCAIWLLSCAVSRDVIVDRPRAPVYLNLYLLLVANSGITRKSAAVGVARSIAAELFADDPLIELIEGKTIPEKLEKLLHDRSRATNTARVAIAVSELASFLGTERYNATMPVLLTDLYDCPASKRGGGTISRGATQLTNVFVNFISASTPTWLFQAVNPTTIAGGFTSRCIFVVAERPKQLIAWSASGASNIAPLICSLRDIRTQGRNYRTITVNAAGLTAFRQWYAKRKHHVDAFNSSFESREDAHVLRLAAFLCINDGTWVIQQSHISTAIKVVGAIKEDAAHLFNNDVNNGRWVTGFDKIRSTLIASGLDPVPRSKLFLKVRGSLDNAEFTALLDVLYEIEAIQRFDAPKSGAGRPADLIRGTKVLTSKGVVERVVSAIDR